MKFEGLFFKPINLFDVVIWFFIITGQVFNIVVVFSSITFGEKQQILLTQSFILSMVTLFFLHRWIANAWNWFFLTVIGVWQIVLFFLYLPYKMLIEWNDLILLMYLPFIVALQLFRLLKIKKHKKGLAIPFYGVDSIYRESAEFIDLMCFLVSMFILFGVPLLSKGVLQG